VKLERTEMFKNCGQELEKFINDYFGEINQELEMSFVYLNDDEPYLDAVEMKCSKSDESESYFHEMTLKERYFVGFVLLLATKW
jgi:hypothetical protein